MNCREAQPLIFAERDGALENSQRAALVSHVDGCAACRRFREDFSATIDGWRNTQQAVRVPDAEREWHKVRREIRGGAGSAAASKSSRVAWFAVPLAAAAAIAVGLFINQGGNTPLEETASVARLNAKADDKPSTVVFTDEKSGWTFVVAADEPHRG